MTGVAPQGSMSQLNAVTGKAIPLVATTAPATGIFGQYWINAASSSAISRWDGTTWVTAVDPYIALLTADPTDAATIADLAECADAGYSRQQATYNAASSTTPITITNSSLITFGPFSVNMTLPCQWLALVSVASGTTGTLLETFTLSSPQQVLATQVITLAPESLSITDS